MLWTIKLEEKLEKWDVLQGNFLSIARRITLIKASLSNTIIYHMSMLLLHKTIIERMEKVKRRFFRQGGKLKRKYHFVRWENICKAEKKDGLGVTSCFKA
jgi:hypothetical protein